MKKILFVNQEKGQCGVYQFGKNTSYILSKFNHIHKFDYIETQSPYNFNNEYDLVIFNHHPSTMPWISVDYFKSKTCRTAMLIHDTAIGYDGCDAYLYPDPTFLSNEVDRNFNVGRPILNFVSNEKVLENTIGSFGFGFNHKGFETALIIINNEFESATFRVHIPLNSKVDESGSYAYAMANKLRCLHKSLNNPNLKLEITHDYKNEIDLLKWLSQNTINVFLYKSNNISIGCSSTVDWAIAAKRPIAVTEDPMFRHINIFAPETNIENGMRNIIEMGIKPFKYIHNNWTERKFYENYCEVVDEILRS